MTDATRSGRGDAVAGAPDAAVIIPHYNDTSRLLRCLSALVPQAARHRVEIVVSDNGSDADMTALQARFPQVKVVVERAKGAANARNAGVAASTAPWLFFLDSDCVPAEDWLDRAMATGGRDVIIGGRVDVFEETPPPRSGAEAFEAVFGFAQRDYIRHKYFSVTANLLTTRAMFEAVGGFDGMVSEDCDWCRRARAKGYDIEYRDDLVVRHPGRATWAALARKWQRVTNEAYFGNGTSVADRVRWALRALVVAVSPAAHLPRMVRASHLTHHERLAGAATLIRLRLARAGWMLRQAMFSDERRI